MKRIKIADVLANPTIGETITVKGWVKANRANRFVQINDGSTIKNIQAVVDFENFDMEILKKDSPKEKVFKETVRCRTIGDMTCTGVWKSEAKDVEAIIEEIATTRMTERGGRTDDKRSETSMEDRKKKGYF